MSGPIALLINHNRPDAAPTAEALRAAGFSVAWSATDEDAVADRGRIDLIVLLPGGDPAGACHRLKAGPLPAAPVLCLSDTAAGRVAALAAGADACLPASATPDELAAAAVALVRHRREAEGPLRRVADGAPVMLAHCDAQARYVFVNRAYAARFGLTPEQVAGRPIVEVVGRGAYERFRRHVEAALRGETVDFEEELPYERIGPRVMRCSYAPEFGPGGEVRGFVAVITDVTDRRRAEAAQARSEGRYRSLVEQAPFSVQVFSPDGRTVRVNRAWEELWGVRAEQVSDYNVLEDQQLEAKGVLPSLRRAFAGEAVTLPAIAYDPEETVPGHSRHADPVRWVSAVAYPLKDEAGRVTEVVLVHEDSTARVKAEEALRRSEELNRRVVESSQDCIKVLDLEGRLLSMSPGGWRALGVADPAPYLGRTWVDFWEGQDREAARSALATALAGGTGRMEGMLPTASGEPRWWDVVLTPVLDAGRTERVLAISRDMTERRRMEQALRDADRKKDEFLGMLGHELRGPLAPLANALQLLRLRGGDPVTVEHARGLAERQVRQLARLVDDLLDATRVARGKLQLVVERVDALQVAAQAVETARPLIETRGHQLHMQLPPVSLWLQADPARLVQILSNLLSNAARYTPTGGKIWLSAERDGGGVLFRVRDNGVGLAPELLPRLFELFGQAQEGAQGGLGIGLALARGLAELHGGSVAAFSDGPGKGSEFVVRLPGLAHAPAADRPQPEAGHLAAPPRRVLVVEDDVDAAESLAALLRLRGHVVAVAHDGAAALDLARRRPPEVALLDLGLPGGLDGCELARRLRQEPGLGGVILVALTGWGREEDRRRAMEAGFEHFAVKPVDVAALEGILART